MGQGDSTLLGPSQPRSSPGFLLQMTESGSGLEPIALGSWAGMEALGEWAGGSGGGAAQHQMRVRDLSHPRTHLPGLRLVVAIFIVFPFKVLLLTEAGGTSVSSGVWLCLGMGG